jgi:hypothetical protein
MYQSYFVLTLYTPFTNPTNFIKGAPMKQYRTNKAGVPLLDKRGQRVPVTPTTGRTIRQNLAVTITFTRKAANHDNVVSGGCK